MDSKLKCVFVLPESNGGVPEVNEGARDSWKSTSAASGHGDSASKVRNIRGYFG